MSERLMMLLNSASPPFLMRQPDAPAEKLLDLTSLPEKIVASPTSSISSAVRVTWEAAASPCSPPSADYGRHRYAHDCDTGPN
jgi:hypothetical protein